MSVPITLPLMAQVLISGVLAGAVYALIALGLALVFGVMGVINISHGALLMLGAYITYWLFTLIGLNPLLSLVISMPALFFLGMLIQKYLIDRVVDAPEMTSLLLTFGISIFLANIAMYLWSSDFRSVPYMTGSVKLGGLAFSKPRTMSFFLALAITICAFLFLKKSRLGKAIRATTQNREVAMACGINVRRVYMISFGLGAAFAAAGGTLASTMFSIYPQMGDLYTIKSFAVIILGGAGNYPGAFLGGIILGLAESLGSFFLSAKLSEAIAYILMIAVLLIRPQGLLGGRS